MHPDLVALGGDQASQRRTQEALESAFSEWTRSERVAGVSEALEAFGQGAPIESCAPLARLMEHPATARSFAAEWARHFSRALAGNKLGLMPFRHSYSPGLSTLQLLSRGTVSLALVTYEEKAGSRPSRSVVFADRTQYEIVIAGVARGFLHSRDPGNGAIESQAQCWRAGDTISLDDGTTAREICEVEGSFAVLQLVRGASAPQPTCEYSLAEGELLHRSCGDKRASQAEMALAVLGEMGRRDAVPAIASLAQSGPDHLRWEAVRHALAMDPREGVTLLTAMAENDQDSLRQPAARLRAQLVAAHPQLFHEETQECPV